MMSNGAHEIPFPRRKFLLGGHRHRRILSHAVSTIETGPLGIEVGRKLGLAAAEARYAKYETGHAVLQMQVEEAEQRTEAAESSLKEFRASSVSEGRRLKKIEQEATLAQKQAAQEQPELAETVDLSFESLELVTATADQGTQDAVADAKMASRELYDNCLVQLRASNQEGGALRLQLGIKEEEVLVLSTSLESWKSWPRRRRGYGGMPKRTSPT